MLTAIYFDNQTRLETNEIGDEMTNRNLAAKFETHEPAIS